MQKRLHRHAVLLFGLLAFTALVGQPLARVMADDLPPQHYKAAAGLMPPAYEYDPDAPNVQSDPEAPVYDALAPFTTTEVGSWPQVLTTGDLTNDGKAEILLANARYFDVLNDEQLHVFSPGTTDTLTRLQQLTAGATPESIILADVTRDGLRDVVVALTDKQALAFYPRTLSITQPLSGPVLLSLPAAPDALARGDFDADLRDDLAVTLPLSGNITLIPGTPSEPAPSATWLRLPLPSIGYNALISGDFDNDGDDDIAALRGAGYLTGSLVIAWQQNGTFPVSTTLSPQTGDYLPHGLAAGDLNNDGLDDLVVTAGGNQPNAFVNLFLQTRNGLASEPVIYPAWHLPSAVAVADINHDGRNDVVAAHDGWRNLSVYRQQPDGTLAPYAVADIPYSSRYRPRALALDDLDGNGSLDVALVGRDPDLVTLSSRLSAPTTSIVTPIEAAWLAPGTIQISGIASVNAVRVEVRLYGLTDWQPTTLINNTWQATLTAPDHDRAWLIEARATDAEGRVQAPVAQRRVGVRGTCLVLADNDQGSNTHTPDTLSALLRTTAELIETRETGTRNALALAFRPATGMLYTVDGRQLGALDPVTGTFSPTLRLLGTGRGAQGEVALRDPHALAFDPRTDILYGVQFRNNAPDLLFQIDPTTGALVSNAFGAGIDYLPLTGSGASGTIEDMAFDPTSGLLYAINARNETSDLITIDPGPTNAGTTQIVGSSTVRNIEGISFSSDGQLYAVTGVQGDTRNRLFRLDKTNATASEVGPLTGQRDYEGLACPTPDSSRAPRIDQFTVNDGATATTIPTVTLTLQASSPASTVQTVFIVEYTFDGINDWTPVRRSERLSYTSTPLSITWQLSPQPGIKYLHAWAIDSTGAVTTLPVQTLIDYNPPLATIARGSGAVHRYIVQQGDQVTIALESLSGNADLAVWAPGGETGQPWVSTQMSGTDQLRFTAPSTGLYQVEVRGTQPAQYRLSFTRTPSGSMQIPSELGITDEPATLQPLIAPESAPVINRQPPETSRLLFLSLIQRGPR